MKERLWTKSFVMLMAGNLFVFMSFQMLIPTLPPYIKSIGASGVEIGLVTALFSIGAVLIRPFIGHMLEYKQRKSLVLIGAVILLVITILYPISRIVMIFLLIRFVHGLAWGWSTTVNGTAAVDVIPFSRLGEGMGYFGLSNTIGYIIAPSLGIFIYNVTTFTNLIVISSILGLISVVLLALVRYQTPEAVVKTKKENLTFSYLDSLVEKSSWFPSLITIIICLGYGSVSTFIVIYGEERGIDQIFLFYILNAIIATVARPFAGKWFDEKGPIAMVYFCICATFVGLWVLSFAQTNFMLAVAGGLFGLGFGCALPILQSWTLSMTPENRRGVANGMFFSSIDLGIGLSGIIFGTIAQFTDTANLFRISSLFLIIAIVLTIVEVRKKRVTPKERIVS
ncbi:MFS transporter [Bacillus sp. EB106-08-02-XG196]|uniref:MFS transporter n=1 Tax=Bacillus sp. EB106-08-02-XG196 TaxID=2737049 RepID=UPI00211B5BE8|nr:MFS transporter [Bacillus sp. EB106-08-02-XG196]